MNQITEPSKNPGQDRPPEFSPGFLALVCLLTVLVLLLILGVERILAPRMLYYRQLQIDIPLVFPWITASNMSLMGYDTKALRLLDPTRLYLLSGILIAFVICPTVFLFGWRQRRLGSGSSPHGQSRQTVSLGYAFGLVVTLFVGVAVIPMNIVYELSNKSRCENDAARLLRYAVVNDLHLVTANVYQYRLLPKELGGGNGSYLGYEIPEKLARTDNAEYTATVRADTVQIRAESATCATNTITLEINKHGSTGIWRYEGNWGVG